MSIAGERERRIGVIPDKRNVCSVILCVADCQDSAGRIAGVRIRRSRSERDILQIDLVRARRIAVAC